MDGVLTRRTVAIALTGTIVLQHSPSEGRRALTLVPDYHLCVVEAEQIVETVPGGDSPAARTRPVGRHARSPDRRRPPTSEMTRIKWACTVPRTLDVILVG